jgi:hypothetical protein
MVPCRMVVLPLIVIQIHNSSQFLISENSVSWLTNEVLLSEYGTNFYWLGL